MRWCGILVLWLYQAGLIAMDALDSRNNFLAMSTSGSKGSVLNIAQISACVGQQNVSGRVRGTVPSNVLLGVAAPVPVIVTLLHSVVLSSSLWPYPTSLDVSESRLASPVGPCLVSLATTWEQRYVG